MQSSLKMGARVALGGKPVRGKGYFYEPSIVSGVTADMPLFREETFGPVAAVIRARDAEEAVALANDSEFGLGGNLWTGDIERGRTLARHIESGGVFINGMTASILIRLYYTRFWLSKGIIFASPYSFYLEAA